MLYCAAVELAEPTEPPDEHASLGGSLFPPTPQTLSAEDSARIRRCFEEMRLGSVSTTCFTAIATSSLRMPALRGGRMLQPGMPAHL